MYWRDYIVWSSQWDPSHSGLTKMKWFGKAKVSYLLFCTLGDWYQCSRLHDEYVHSDMDSCVDLLSLCVNYISNTTFSSEYLYRYQARQRLYHCYGCCQTGWPWARTLLQFENHCCTLSGYALIKMCTSKETIFILVGISLLLTLSIYLIYLYIWYFDIGEESSVFISLSYIVSWHAILHVSGTYTRKWIQL